MESVKVSVVIPVYNAETYLNETLGDITGQTLQEIEIICVDDGSTDQSTAIIEQWQKRDGRIHLIRQENQYAGVARNHGMEHAHGKYIIFWDADDLFHTKALERLYLQAEKENTDICICAAQRYDHRNRVYLPSKAFLRTDLLPEKETFNKFDIPENIFNLATNVPWNKLYKREFIEEHKIRYQPLRQANDTYFTIMAFFFAQRISYVTDVLVSYRINNETSLSGKASNTVFCAYDSWAFTRDAIKNDPDYPLVRLSFLNRALSGFFHSLDIQTDFDAYQKLYHRLVEEGFRSFGLTACKEEEIYEPWMFCDMQKMMEMTPEDFLIQKDNARRVNADYFRGRVQTFKGKNKELKEKLKSRKEEIKKLKQENKKLQEENKKLRKKYREIQESISYRLGRLLLWLPRNIKKVFRQRT